MIYYIRVERGLLLMSRGKFKPKGWHKSLFILFMVGLWGMGIFLGGCGSTAKTSSSQPAQPEQARAKVKVMVTLFPVYDFVRQVGGERVEVQCLLPAGTDMHEFELRPQDVNKLQQCQLLVAAGAGVEPWLAKIKSGLSGKVVDISQGIDLRPGDPHYWLDPVRVMQVVDNVAQALSEVDPAGANYYQQRAREYKGKLEELHHEYMTVLTEAKQRRIYAVHAGYGYLCERYQLQQFALQSSGEEEVSPTRLAEMIKQVRSQGVRYVFADPSTSQRLKETLVREAGVKIMPLRVMDVYDQEMLSKSNYIDIMHNNLQVLREVLTTTF